MRRKISTLVGMATLITSITSCYETNSAKTESMKRGYEIIDVGPYGFSKVPIRMKNEERICCFEINKDLKPEIGDSIYIQETDKMFSPPPYKLVSQTTWQE